MSTPEKRIHIQTLAGGLKLYQVQLVGGPLDGKPGLCSHDTVYAGTKDGLACYLRGADDRYYWQDPNAKPVIVKTTCAHCGHAQESKSINGARTPAPGKPMLCGECLELSIYDIDGTWRRLTDQEQRELMLSDDWPRIEAFRKKLSKPAI